MDADTKTGIVSNTVGVGVILAISYALGVVRFGALAILIQWLVFALHGLPQNSEKFYDASGSATHLALIVLSLAFGDSAGSARHPRQIVNSVFCVMWLTRLGSYLFARILRDGRDERFDKLKTNPVRFLGAWTVQALWVFLLELPVVILNNKEMSDGITILDMLGWSLWCAGFLIEAIADTQKNVFRSREANKANFITTGLWAFSRHPNYLGEMMLWTGVCLSASSSFEGLQFMGWFSLAITCVLLLKVTGIPVLEASGAKKWGHLPAYNHYMAHTNALFFGSPAPPLTKDE